MGVPSKASTILWVINVGYNISWSQPAATNILIMGTPSTLMVAAAVVIIAIVSKLNSHDYIMLNNRKRLCSHESLGHLQQYNIMLYLPVPYLTCKTFADCEC